MSTSIDSTLSPELAARLAELRDIRLPESISWWPIAPAWWALLTLIVAAVAALFAFVYYKRRSLKFRSLKELEQLRNTLTLNKAHSMDVAAEVSVLLRRVMLATPAQRQNATLHGNAWESYLCAETSGMPNDVARLLSVAPYAPSVENTLKKARTTPSENAPQATLIFNELPTIERIFDAAKSWIRSHT